MGRSRITAVACLGLLLGLALAPRASATLADDAQALGGTCYWQSSRGLSESALAFRDRVEAALGFDLFAECTAREQTWGVTVIDCAASSDTPWTLTLRVGFPGGLDRWQACITKIESGDRVVYSAHFLFRYRAQIAAAGLLYAALALARALRRRRSG